MDIRTYKNTESVPYELREVIVNDITYVVAPVIMMVEGVHSGSHGALYHSSTELSKSVKAWDGAPVVIDHPQNESGQYISVNSVPDRIIGMVKNPIMDGNKLKADIYLEKDKTSIASPTTMTLLTTNKTIEVSIGVFNDEIKEEGEWNGEKYNAIATNHIPDHLAILPTSIGACSIKDGCGIRVNESKNNNMENENVINLINHRTITVNELGFGDIMDMIWDKLRSMNVEDSQGNRIKSCYSEAIYDKYLIYQENTIVGKESKRKYYQQNYNITDANQIEFIGNPVEVVKELKYKQVQTNKQGGLTMADNKKPCPDGSGLCKEAKVEALIANELTSYTLADKEMLMGLDEAIIDRMTPIKPEPIVVNKEVQVPIVYKTTEEFLQAAPDGIRDSLRTGLQLNEERRANLIQSILTNSVKDTWTEDELKVMETTQLEKLNRSYPVVASYAGNGQAPKFTVSQETKQEDMLLPNGVVISK